MRIQIMKAARKTRQLYLVALTVAVSACGHSAQSKGETVSGGILPVTTLERALINQGVPRAVVKTALLKRIEYDSFIIKPDNMAIIDFTQLSGKTRFYLINTRSG